ncbi:HAMP domain-containing sensor histidine kinase [Nocardioides sp. AN3]
MRARLMSIGLLGLAVALAVGSIGLYAALSVEGLRRVDRAAAVTTGEVAGLVRAGRLPQTLPASGVSVIQVLDDRARVVSASSNSDRLTSILRPDELDAALHAPVTVSGSRLGIASQLRIRASRVETGTGTMTIVVAEPVDDLVESSSVLRLVLMIGYPLILVVLALIAWRVIGAALRPVEALRSAAERISGSGRGDRLPVPPADDEVRALAVTLNSMLDRLDGARERERGFVADAAHELRNPLASMRMQIDVARRLDHDEELLADLDADVSRMSSLVEDLLVIARIDAGTPAVPAGEVADLRLVLASAADGLPVSVPIEIEPSVAEQVQAPATDLIRVFGNVFANAVRYASSVHVSVHRRGDLVVVWVDDDGPGIAASDRARAFERFTRLDDARDRDSGGAGLGLAIVRETVRSRGGEVRLDDSPAGGLRVEVVLPRHPDCS